MEFFPLLELSWLNGWIFILINSLITWGFLKFVPKEVSRRLLDRSNFTKEQKIWTIISKIFSLLNLILLFLSPLVFSFLEFYIGLGLFMIGEVGLIIAILNFVQTPINEPVVKGLYRISRNPQDVFITIVFIGICLMVGSWIALIILFVGKFLSHFRTLAEEQACIKQYGEIYLEYMKKIPRYFLFF